MFNFKPKVCQIEILDKCNLYCKHCYLPNKGNKFLDYNDIENILIQIADEGFTHITITGGEPLLHRNFLKIVRKCDTMGFAIRIFTNGTLLNEKVIEEISSLNVIMIDISIYGSCDETYKKFANNSTGFSRLKKNLDLLNAYKIPFSLKTSVTKYNFRDLESMRNIAKQYNVELNESAKILADNNGDDYSASDCRLNEKEFEEYFKLSRRVYERTVNDNLMNVLEDFICDAGTGRIFISSDGRIQPCIQVLKNYGSIYENQIRAVIESETFKEVSNMKYKDLNECKGCKLLPICAPVCVGLNQLLTGSFTKCSKSTCEYSKIVNKYLNLV